MTTYTRLFGALLMALAQGHAICAAPPPATQAEAPLAVCLADANPPFSASSLPEGGLDAELARAIGRQLGREIRLVWVTIPNRGGLGKALGQQLGGGACKLFAGIPESGGPNEDLAEKHLVTSDSYLETGYVLAGAHGKLYSLAEARRLKRIGVVTATPADLYLFQQQLGRVPYGSNEALLAALAEASVDAAVLWQPALARARLQGQAPATRFIPLPDASRTRFVIAMPRKDTALLTQVNAALTHLQTDGSLASLLQTYGLAP